MIIILVIVIIIMPIIVIGIVIATMVSPQFLLNSALVLNMLRAT